ncbi:MAG: hypothetical protein HY690_19620 [Chloroflexi bacterium]|nr:hypothetical protein [Chloroflexota bacterium]
MDDIDRAIERIDRGGEAWKDTDEVVEVAVKRPLDTVVPVRVSADTWEALRREARRIGVGPSTLVRMWVLEKLREVAPSRRST